MIKKISAYSFIFIASLILLAHDMVFHHHHEDNAVEIKYSDSSLTDKDHNHNHSFPEHKHIDEDSYFILRQVIISSPFIGKLSESDDEHSDYHSLDFHFISTNTSALYYFPPRDKIPIWEKSVDIPIPVTCSFGLRAPPAV
jgi:hypothetical protein